MEEKKPVLSEQDKFIKISNEILELSRHMVFVSLRFLSNAVHRFKTVPLTSRTWKMFPQFHADGHPLRCGTDGTALFYQPEYLIQCYKKEASLTSRMYLHSLLHCVFQHFYIDTTVDQRLWNLACDISVEAVICELELSGTRTEQEVSEQRELDHLQELLPNLTAERIFQYLKEKTLTEDQIKHLEALFKLDDHHLWYADEENSKKEKDAENDESKTDEQKKKNQNTKNEDDEKSLDSDAEDQQEDLQEAVEGSQAKDGGLSKEELEEQNMTTSSLESERKKKDDKERKEAARDGWKKISLQIQMELETFLKDRGEKAGFMVQNLRAVNRESYDYKKFLEKFAVLGEALQMNDQEFDYIFYTYGLQMYGNVPLIEPLEYKEVKKVKDFVIVIDTSGSTKGELVQAFVQKTFNILKQQEHFHQKMNLHIIQCDAMVQEDVKITTEAELNQYLKKMKIRGQGGTDFRPAFTYVDELVEKGEFENLKGMIYFTDGYGIFPKKQPKYKVAVVYVEEDYENPDVPVWAIKLVLKPEEIKNEY